MRLQGYQVTRWLNRALAIIAVLLTIALLIVTLEINLTLATVAGAGCLAALWFLVTTVREKPIIPLAPARPSGWDSFDDDLPWTKETDFEHGGEEK